MDGQTLNPGGGLVPQARHEILHRARRVPVVLTDEEQQALLAAPDRRTPTGLRNYWMLRLCLNLGLRSKEVRGLEVSHVDWLTARLVVREGKGGRDRALWLSQADHEGLQDYRQRRPAPEAPHLFTTLQGGPISGRQFRATVKRLSVRAGITHKDVHPHTLRHTFATDLYRRTKNLRLVQKAMGHASISTTQVYTHVVDDELEAALRTFRDTVAVV